jgi:hypothetical protein
MQTKHANISYRRLCQPRTARTVYHHLNTIRNPLSIVAGQSLHNSALRAFHFTMIFKIKVKLPQSLPQSQSIATSVVFP